ncbi:MAG: hypothetical protein AAF975_04995, partial [Spirochaetota bacterium]
QVCDIFDSLWQGYPIGHILLLEQVPPDLARRLLCCTFEHRVSNQNLDENLRKRRGEAQIFEECKEASHLVLDGQQRLFAFYIGISGAYLRFDNGDSPESAKLYFDLFPLVKLFFENEGNLKSLRAEHHQFRFYSESQLADYAAEVQSEIRDGILAGTASTFPLLPLSLVRRWGRDRRTAKSEIRHFLKPLLGLPKALVEELEDMLDNLHHHFWINRPLNNITVAPADSYELVEIFSRLNQGSSFQPSDLHYAMRIIFPQTSPQHNFSRYLSKTPGKLGEPQPATATLTGPKAIEPASLRQHYTDEELAELSVQEWNSEIFHELNPEHSAPETGSPHNDELEENYERLLQATDELKVSLDFLYHCYLFCEGEAPGEVARNIRKKEGVLALRNNGDRLLHFAATLDTLRDAMDSCNFIVRHWFGGNLHNDYVLLPVLYFFYRQAAECLDPLNDLRDVDLSRIVRWIALNEVAPSVFRGGVQQLAKLWPILYHSARDNGPRFPLRHLQHNLQLAFGSSPGSNPEGKAADTAGKKQHRALVLSDAAITQLLEHTKIKHRACVPLIALLYSHPQRISLMQRYEERQIDFIQPQKLLSKRMLKTYGLTDEQVELFFAWRDSVLNLQWLPKRLQTEKGDIPFRQWLSNSQQLQFLGEQNQFPKKELLINFMRFHHIKTEDGIHTFERFLNERKLLLFHTLKQYSQDFSDWDLQVQLTKISFPAF